MNNNIVLEEIILSFLASKKNAEKGMAQIAEADFFQSPDPDSNTIAILVQHMSGNMLSRFTDFLTTDGEKQWRDRDSEFENILTTKEEVMQSWEKGWSRLLDTLATLSDSDLEKTVFIRNEPHSVLRALLRQLSHYAYHCGQIVFLCKHLSSGNFKTLSIAKGESKKFVSSPPPPTPVN